MRGDFVHFPNCRWRWCSGVMLSDGDYGNCCNNRESQRDRINGAGYNKNKSIVDKRRILYWRGGRSLLCLGILGTGWDTVGGHRSIDRREERTSRLHGRSELGLVLNGTSRLL